MGRRSNSLALLALTASAAVRAQQAPGFLDVAEHLVDDLQVSAQSAPEWPNVYGTTPSYIEWSGAASSARTECSSFVTLLWQHAYGWTPASFKAWTGHSSPEAAVYHDTIAAHEGFDEITTVGAIRPGDVVAIVYYPEYQSPTGHLMIVAAQPQANSSAPLVAGTDQWTIDVVDSSSTYHGTADTRYAHPGGIGRGTFRLYTNPDGTFAGHTWSLLGTSLASYYPQPTTTQNGRHLVVGRLTRSIFATAFEAP